MDDDHIEKVHENHCLTFCEIAEEVGISKSSCHKILTEKLQIHHVATKFVPCLLADE